MTLEKGDEIDGFKMDMPMGYPTTCSKEELIGYIQKYTIQCSITESEYLQPKFTALAQIGISELQRRTGDQISTYALIVAVISLLVAISPFVSDLFNF